MKVVEFKFSPCLGKSIAWQCHKRGQAFVLLVLKKFSQNEGHVG